LNLGSGQKHLEGYVNVDISDNHGHQVDVIADVTEAMPMFEDNSAETIIAEHVLEHVYLHRQEATLREWYRILAPGGRLVISVPDLHALATRYLRGELSFFLYAVNKFGPYNGNDADFHKWGFDEPELRERLSVLPWRSVERFHGAEPIARDWWILDIECQK
jgi:SAM-dependent methyltransferase